MKHCVRTSLNRKLRGPLGPSVIVGILAALAAAGCQVTQQGIDPSEFLPTSEDLLTFIEDFARQVLAAFLL